VLARLGVCAALEARQPVRLKGMRIVSPKGSGFVGYFAGDHAYRPHSPYGLALRREVLDLELARAAVGRGARIFEGTVVEGVAQSERRHRALTVRCGSRRSTLRTRLLIGADGLNSRVARRLGVTRRGRRRRIAFVSHASGVAAMGNVGEMHVGSSGYVGLAPVGDGLTNVAAVVDLDRNTPQGPPPKWFRKVLWQYPAVSERLANASFETPVRTVGPFARWVTRASADRALLVGDAADFYDPFTGEGIYAALRGAELAAAEAAVGLEADRLDSADLAAYDRARRRVFGGKWVVERLASWALAHPRVFDHLTDRLAARQKLADLLVGVAGDFVPPSAVLRPSFVWQLVR
jgi:flavin-dependent dehydrogenase